MRGNMLHGYGKRTDISEYRLQTRGGKGIKAMNLTDKTGLLAAQLLVPEEEDIMLMTDDGTLIRMPVSGISVLGRATQGVRLMRVENGARVVCVSRAEAEDEDEGGDAPEADTAVCEAPAASDLDMDAPEDFVDNPNDTSLDRLLDRAETPDDDGGDI